MKIKLVGTGSIEANERSSSTLIDDKLLVDMGNGITKTIVQEGDRLEDIEAILITHLHGDHFADIPFFMVNRMRMENVKKIKIYCPKDTQRRIKELCGLYFGEDAKNHVEEKLEKAKIEFVEFENMDRVEVIEGYFVTSYLVSHADCVPSYGFVVEHEGKKIGFSGDSKVCDGVNKIVEESDVSVLDTCLLVGEEPHMGFYDVYGFAKKYPKKIFISTHLRNQTRKFALENRITNLIIPNDGSTIEIE